MSERDGNPRQFAEMSMNGEDCIFANGGKPMPGDISFEHPDWAVMPQPPNNCECAWKNSDGLVISLSRLGEDKGLRDRVGDVKRVRDHYRAGFAKQGLGLVECDTFDLEGVRAVRAIGKVILQPTRAAYAGTIALPLPKESYVLNVIAQETGITGIRETAVMFKVSTELEKQGFALDLPQDDKSSANNAPIIWRNTSTGAALHWTQDPYDPEIQGACLRNMAEAPEYDAGFPQHPLSRVRTAMRCLTQGIRLSPELKRRAEGKKR